MVRNLYQSSHRLWQTRRIRHILVICNNNRLLFLQLQQLLWYWIMNVFYRSNYTDTFEYESQVNIYFSNKSCRHFVSNKSCFIDFNDKKSVFFTGNGIEYMSIPEMYDISWLEHLDKHQVQLLKLLYTILNSHSFRNGRLVVHLCWKYSRLRKSQAINKPKSPLHLHLFPSLLTKLSTLTCFVKEIYFSSLFAMQEIFSSLSTILWRDERQKHFGTLLEKLRNSVF